MTETHPPILGTTPIQARRFPGWPSVLITSGIVGALALLYWHHPEGQFFYPRCTLYASTGLLCPTCGGLRATHDLLHGRWLEALRDNALLVAAIPLGLGWWIYRSTRHPAPTLPRSTLWILMGVTALFTVLRNLPWSAFRWLSP
jgi:hypothetical protein